MNNRLKTAVASALEIEPDALSEEASSETIADWDSVKQINIILAVEDEFGVRFPEERIEDLSSYRLIRDELASMGITFS